MGNPGLIVMLMLVLVGGTTASAQVVTNTSDSGPGTLRAAIANATNDATITFCTNLSGATITLSNTLTINTNLTIDASALPGGIQINGNDSVQIFNVVSNNTVMLNSLTITNGETDGDGGGILNDGTLTVNNCTLSGNSTFVYGNHVNGGGIYNSGTLTVNNSMLARNSCADGYGGGIYNGGTLTVNNCTLSGNNTGDFGGGIFNGGTLTLNQCMLSGNSAADGGGIFNVGALTLNQSTLSGNSTGVSGDSEGGGIYNGSTLTLNQCTLSGNSVSAALKGYGGGIASLRTLTLNQCTLSGNSASGDFSYGGGICIIDASGIYPTLMITNSIVAGNSAGSGGDIYIPNNYSYLTYGGSNIVQLVYYYYGSTVTGPEPINAAPLLAPLGNYGGPTQTLPPLPGSPAISAGSVAANTFANDQRGYPREQNGLIDIGAVELPTIQFTASPTNGFQPLTVQFNCPSVDSDGSSITQWNWSFGDNNTSTAQNPSDAYSTVGSFTPSLIVTNNLGLAVPGSGPSITTFPPPAITGINLSGANLMINGTNGVSGLTYYVLTSTNLALPFNQWTPMATNVWSANGNFNLTVTNIVNPSIVMQFYILQVP
jgi:hypothetical protein